MTAVLDASRALHDQIRDDVATMQSTRRLTTTVVEGLRAAGVFDMASLPSLGGPGLDPIQQFEVFEALSLADASVGWCAMIGADTGYYPGFLHDDAVAELYPTPGLITAGKVAPGGEAVQTDHGWRITGRWDFGSGSTHADRFVGGAFLHDTSGEPIVQNGMPAWRVFYLPAEQVVVHDTWDTIGLRATASNDYEVVDAVVPDHWGFEPLGPMWRDDAMCRLPWWFIVKVGGVHTALARRAIDEAIAAAEQKFLVPGFTPLSHRPGTADVIARVEADARSARAFLVDEISRVWEACVAGGDVGFEVTAPLRLALVHASQVAVDTTRAMFDLLTTTSIRSGSIHAQLMADAAVANTHVATGPRTWNPIGQRLMGREPSPPGPFV